MLSLREFAKLAKVSRSTVSRAFQKEGKINDTTRARILQLAEEHNFRPSPVMRPAARRGLTESVGVLYPGFAVSYFDDIHAGLQNFLLDLGFLPIMLGVTANTVHASLNRLVDHRIDGLVMTVWEGALLEEDRQRIKKLAVPTVLLCHQSDHDFVAADSVGTDDRQGGELAARHLLELGHRRIALVGTNATVHLRCAAFQEEVERHGLRLLVAPQGMNDAEQLRILLNNPDPTKRPTAVFTSTDIGAARLYHTALEEGLSIPYDLSIVGYADLNIAPLFMPSLTTVRQDGHAVGIKAGEYIVDRIRGNKGPLRHSLVPTELIVRESTAPPAARPARG